MKTNLNRTITTIEEAKAFLRDLHTNNEVFHPEDDAHDIVWGTTTVSAEECDQLNELMNQIYEGINKGCDASNMVFDPCGFLIDLDHESEEYFVKDNSGRGYTNTVGWADLMKWDTEEQETNDELYDWLNDNSVGDEFEYGTTTITRTK